MLKAGGILAIVGSSLSLIPVLFMLGTSGLIAGIESELEDSGGSEFVQGFEEGAEMSTEQLVAQAFGALMFCAGTLVCGIVALNTKRPIILGIVTICCSIIGLSLGGLFALALFLSLIGGILICFGKPKVKDQS